MLTHYQNDLPLSLTCDASFFGVGTVLAHVLVDGAIQPIAYTSQTLSPAEKKYSQVDRESLAIITAVIKFRQCLLGRTISDHIPLIHLFSSSRAIPHLASTRIQRWALILSGYDYTIFHKSGRDNLDADSLSRLPLPDVPSGVPLPGECVLLLQTLKQSATVTAKQIQTWTNTDPVLSKVHQFVLHGWPRVEEKELKPFFRADWN